MVDHPPLSPTDGAGVRQHPLRSIRFRILSAFILAFSGLLGAQGFLFWQNQQIAGSLTVITDGYLPLARIVAQLDRDHQRIETDIRRLLSNRPGPASTSPTVIYTDQLAENLRIGRGVVQRAQRLDIGPDEVGVLKKLLSQFDRIESLAHRYQSESTTLLDASARSDADQVGAMAKPLTRTGAELGVEIDKLDRQVNDRIRKLTVATERAQARATTIAGALTVVAVLLSLLLVLAVLIALRPIARLTTQVQRLAAGDYSERLGTDGGDELAVLAGEINAMADAIELRDRRLIERAEQLNRLSRYLGSVLDTLEDALVVVENHEITLANPAAERLWSATVGDAPSPELAELVDHTGRQEHSGPHRSHHEARTTPFGEGGAIVISADVTDQHRDRARLARSERLALIGQMLAQVTHEVRNPLNSLSLNADLLGDELTDLDPDKRTEAWELLAMIASEIDRLTSVTGHYLQLARRPPARLAAEDIATLLDDVTRLLQPELEQHSATIEVSAAELGLQLVDGNQLRQALLNVVRNALQAGATRLKLTLSADTHDLHLALTDNGPGMDDEQIARATDPFFTTKVSGTGLGLAITRQILEDHDGSVVVTSAPDEGTTITLTLPLRPTGDPA